MSNPSNSLKDDHDGYPTLFFDSIKLLKDRIAKVIIHKLVSEVYAKLYIILYILKTVR